MHYKEYPKFNITNEPEFNEVESHNNHTYYDLKNMYDSAVEYVRIAYGKKSKEYRYVKKNIPPPIPPMNPWDIYITKYERAMLNESDNRNALQPVQNINR